MVENTWRLSVLIGGGQNIQGTLCKRSPWDEGCSVYFFLFVFHSESKASIENASGNTITSAYCLAYLRSSSSGAHTSTPPHQHSHWAPPENHLLPAVQSSYSSGVNNTKSPLVLWAPSPVS